MSFQSKRVRNIYGIDYASKNDYFAVVLHQLPEYVQGSNYLPTLKTLRKYPHTNYAEMLQILERDLFRRFPPFYIVPDYTSEKTFTDLLIDSYGADLIEPIVFSTSTKKMLKEDGLSMMSQGYEFPNPSQISHPLLSSWISGMISELLSEQLITTRSNNISFDHPTGQHNDLAIAWELSIHGCLRFSLRPKSAPAIASSNGKRNTDPVKNPEDFVKELKKNPYIKLNNVQVSSPTEAIH